MGFMKKLFNNVRKPQGFWGGFMCDRMNSGHGNLSEWGRSKLPGNLEPHNIADLGCGGGRNASALLKKYPKSELTAVDYSEVSVQKTRNNNRDDIAIGRCTVMQGDVSELPLMDDYFDLATAIETVYFWPGPEKSFREVLRILKKDGLFLIVNECDGSHEQDQKWASIIDDMKLFNEHQLKDILLEVGFEDVSIHREEKKGWIALVARK